MIPDSASPSTFTVKIVAWFQLFSEKNIYYLKKLHFFVPPFQTLCSNRVAEKYAFIVNWVVIVAVLCPWQISLLQLIWKEIGIFRIVEIAWELRFQRVKIWYAIH